VWQDEIVKHGFDGLIEVYNANVGSVRLQAGRLNSKLQEIKKPVFMVLVNYERVWRPPLITALIKAGFNLMLVDESHRIKAHNSAVSKGVYEIGKAVPKRFLLTGTPLVNGLMDAYGQWRLIDPKLLVVDTRVKARYPSFFHFRNFFCNLEPIRGVYGAYKIVGFKNVDEFNRRMASVTLHIRSESVLDLPSRIETVVPVELPPNALKHYRNLRDRFITDIRSGVVTVDNVLVKSLRLHQLVGGFIPADNSSEYTHIHSAKLDACFEIIEDLPPAEKVVIFAKYTSEVKALEGEAVKRGYRVCVLSGSRNELARWQQGPHEKIIIVQIDTGAEGISLVQAKYVIYYSVTYSLGTFEQSQARVSRPGQKSSTVWYYYLTAINTIDGIIVDALKRKAKINESVYEALKQ